MDLPKRRGLLTQTYFSLIGRCDQARLIHINLRTDRFLKTFIARIQIYPHNHSSYIPIIQKPLAINKYLLVIMYFYTKF